MKKIYSLNCGKYRKIKNHKISCFCKQRLVLSIIFNKCENEHEKIFKEEESNEIFLFISWFN